MDWYQENTFLFNRDIGGLTNNQFIFACSLICVTILLISYGFWFGARLNTWLKNPPRMRLTSIYFLNLAACIGVFSASFVIFLFLGLLYLILGGNRRGSVFLGLFNSVEGDFIHNSLSNLDARNGRYGLAFAIYGSLGLLECLSKLGHSPVSFVIRYQHESNEKKFIYNFSSLVIVVLYSLIINFFSFSPEFNSSRQFMYVAMISTFGELLKLRLAHKTQDVLMAIPFLLTIELLDLFMSRFAANTFLQLFINLIWMVMLRYTTKLYLTPAIDHFKESFSENSPKLIERLTDTKQGSCSLGLTLLWKIITFNNLTKKLSLSLGQFIFHFDKDQYNALKKLLLSSSMKNKNFQIIEFSQTIQAIFLAKEIKKQFYKQHKIHYRETILDEEKENETEDSADSLISILIPSSIENISNIMIFLFTIFIWAFSDQLKIEQFSNGIIGENYIKYTLFSLVCMIILFLCDPFLFNAIEYRYGYKFYDYLVYCRYRFMQRDCYWSLDNLVADETITIRNQRFDLMCLSPQYYFMITLTSLHILLIIIGIQICIINSYSPFIDYCAIPIFIICLILLIIGKFCLFKGYRLCMYLFDSRYNKRKLHEKILKQEDKKFQKTYFKNGDNKGTTTINSISQFVSSNDILMILLFWSFYYAKECEFPSDELDRIINEQLEKEEKLRLKRKSAAAEENATKQSRFDVRPFTITDFIDNWICPWRGRRKIILAILARGKEREERENEEDRDQDHQNHHQSSVIVDPNNAKVYPEDDEHQRNSLENNLNRTEKNNENNNDHLMKFLISNEELLLKESLKQELISRSWEKTITIMELLKNQKDSKYREKNKNLQIEPILLQQRCQRVLDHLLFTKSPAFASVNLEGTIWNLLKPVENENENENEKDAANKENNPEDEEKEEEEDGDNQNDDLYSLEEIIEWVSTICLALICASLLLPQVIFVSAFCLFLLCLFTKAGRVILREICIVCFITFSGLCIFAIIHHFIG